MTAAIGQFAPGDSWLYRLDPRVKLLHAFLGIVLCLIASRVEALAILLVVTHIILFVGGVSPLRIVAAWGRLAVLLIIILIIQPLFSSGGSVVLARIGPITITADGILAGLRIALRVASAAFIALTPILTTPIPALVRGLEKIGLPYTWGMTVGLALRYLETLTELYQTINEAQQARGWDTASRNIVQRVRAAIPTLIAIIIASLRLSDSLALGMAARGFGLSRPRTHRMGIAMRAADWIAIGVVTIAFVAALFSRVNP